MFYRLIIFLIINFAALAIGGSFTSEGVPSEWYTNLSKAPWTPPGWVFGAAWTTIMVCFAFYMSAVWKRVSNKKTITFLYLLQIILNISWNPTFFYFHYVLLGFVIIFILTVVVSYILFKYWNNIKIKSILILPYLIWLFIATSLNAYILIYN
jgi:tryptophan-rich sensory protein